MDTASVTKATAEETTTLIEQIDATWCAKVEEEQRESVEAQTKTAALQAEIQELQRELLQAKEAALAPVPRAWVSTHEEPKPAKPQSAKLTSASLSAAQPGGSRDDPKDSNFLLNRIWRRSKTSSCLQCVRA